MSSSRGSLASRIGPRRAPTTGATNGSRQRSEWQGCAASEPGYGSALAAGPSGGRRVLVADDEAGIRLLCRVNLQVAGVEVLEAGDGTAALAIARRERPDLILLDVMMPELDGIEVARRLQAEEETRDIPIVFLTARAGADDRRRGHAVGGIAYLVKPFNPIVLADYIEGLLEAIGRGEREELRKRIVEEG